MKNLTRILALVLVFTMMISTAAFAGTFSDVAEDSTYADATTVLSALGILNGYEDGTFKPEAVITRAEVVAVANRLQGLSDAAKAAANVTKYTDVPSTAWYAGDVNLATQMGIVSGDGNGLFRPDDQVKYEEAVKMMVAALGYHQEYVLKQGGWPTGYLVIATEKGVTKGLSVNAGEPAYRGIVAKLAYQSLTAPMMVLNTYDDEGKATYRADTSKTLLGTKLGFAKVSGYVSANEVSSLTSTTGAKKGHINYTFPEDKYTINDKEHYVSYVGNEGLFNGSIFKTTLVNIEVGETDVADTLGYATEVYLDADENDDVYVVTYVNADVKNDIAKIEKPSYVQKTGKGAHDSDYKIDPVDKVNYVDGTISVYDDDADVDEEYVLDHASIIYNDKYVEINDKHTPDDINTWISPAYGSVELLDNDGDGAYEFVFVTAYETKVVKNIFADNTKIGFYVGGKSLDLTAHIKGKEGHSLKITLDGKEIDITDLQEYDVLSVAQDMSGKNVDIIVSRNVVEGEVDSFENATNFADKVITIAGKEYGLAVERDIDSTTEGKFYIDFFGNIAYHEGDNALPGKVAFVLAAAETEGTRGKGFEAELLNEDGSIVTLSFASNVKINDADADSDNYVANLKAKFDFDDNDKLTADTTAKKANRVVTYKVNSSNKISAINFAKSGTAEKLTYKVNDKAEFDGSVNSFDSYGVTENTIVFNISGTDIDDYDVASSTMFADEGNYKIAVLNVDDDFNAGIILVAEGGAEVGIKSSLAIVTKAVEIVDPETETKIVKVTFLQDGKEEVKSTSVDANFNVSDFAVGSVFEYKVDAAGAIEEITFGYDYFDKNVTSFKKKAATWSAIEAFTFLTDKDDNTEKSTDVSYIGGYVMKVNDKAIVLSNKAGISFDANGMLVRDGDKLAIPDSANVYTMNVDKTKIKPEIASFGDIVQLEGAKEDNGEAVYDEGCDTFVLIKYVDRTIVDVIAYTGFLY